MQQVLFNQLLQNLGERLPQVRELPWRLPDSVNTYVVAWLTERIKLMAAVGLTKRVILKIAAWWPDGIDLNIIAWASRISVCRSPTEEFLLLGQIGFLLNPEPV